MKLLVCGGRNYTNTARVNGVLDDFNELGDVELIIEGGAWGADRLARQWARARGIPVATVEADWEGLGRRAGPVRNAAMLLLEPDAVIAFPGGTGTANMIRQARGAGVEVHEFTH